MFRYIRDNSPSLIATNNLGIGNNSLLSITTGTNNVAIGTETLFTNKTGEQNIAIGYRALYGNNVNSNMSGCTAVGFETLRNNDIGGNNSAFGSSALYSVSFGDHNCAFGTATMQFNTSGARNAALGNLALFENTNGHQNTAVGYEAMRRSRVSDSVGIGYQALYGGSGTVSNNNGTNNVAIGAQALRDFTSASSNVAAGYFALRYFDTSNNTAVGFEALRGGSTTVANNTGANNIAIGYRAGDAITTGSTNIVIGYDIDVDSATASNQINIGAVYYHDRIRLANTSAPSITFGGTTSSFPSLKRSSTSLQVRLADDSNFGSLNSLVDLSATQAADSIGTRGVPQNSQSAAYTLVAADAGQHILHPASDDNARTFTIPANSSVSYPVGTVITFINLINTVTIAITSDTLTLAGVGSTGSRTLAANGIATAIKVGSTSWLISGSGLT